MHFVWNLTLNYHPSLLRWCY